MTQLTVSDRLSHGRRALSDLHSIFTPLLIGRVRALLWAGRLASVGRGCRIDRGVTIRHPGKVALGNNVWLKEGVILDGRGRHSVNIEIGTNATIRAYTYIDTYNGFVKIGQNCDIAQHVYIGGNGGVQIGTDVMVAANTCITSVAHGCDPSRHVPYVLQEERRRPVKIHNNVWIAANVTIIDGVEINTGAVVGAGAVVTRSVSAYSFVAGNPARLIKKLQDCPGQHDLEEA